MAHFPAFRRVVRFALLLTVMLLPAALAPHAGAQGTYGQLPDPISSAELNKLCKYYLHPTPDQQASIETLHDEYRERFKALREGDIEKFMSKMKTLQGGMPSKEDMDEFMRGYERIHKQIADVDDAFLEAIATRLGEASRPAVQRARDARIRIRSASGVMGGMANRQNRVELTEIVADAGLDAKDAAAAEPVILAHEQRATALTKELGQAEVRMVRDMFEELEKSGITKMSQEDMMASPEKMQEMMTAVQAAMQKATVKIRAKMSDLMEQNDKTHQSLQEQLTGPIKRKLKMRFYTQAYPEVGEDPVGAERMFLRTLRIKSLDKAAHDQVQEAYDRWQVADDALVAQGLKAVKAMRADLGMGMAFGGDGYSEFMKAQQEVRQKRTDAGVSALDSVRTAIGEEQLNKLKTMVAKTKTDMFDETGDPTAPEEVADAGGVGLGVRAAEAEAQRRMYDAVGERSPMGKATVDTIATQLSLDAARRSVVDTMFADYESKWKESMQPLREQAEKAGSSIWVQDTNADNGAMRMDEGKSAAYFDARKALIARSTELDAAFINDLGSALGDEAKPTLMLLKLGRVIERTDRGAQTYTGFGNNETAAVNLSEVLFEAGLSPQERAMAWSALEPQIDALIKANLEAQASGMDMQRQSQEWSARNQEVYKDGKPDMEALQHAQAMWMNLQQQSEQIQQRRNDAMESAWKAAIGGMSDERKASLQRAYDERAYPSIYKDARSAAPLLKKAADLTDLTDEQKAKLLQLTDRYRAEHQALCQKMHPKRTPPMTGTSQQEMQAYWQQQAEAMNVRERVCFERDENSHRAVNQLRRILTEEQVKRLAGLDEYEKAAGDRRAGNFGVALD